MTTPCTTCIKANPIATCSTEWVDIFVGTDYNALELFYIVTNVATGAYYTGLTDAVSLGYATITLPDDLTELMGHYYKLELYTDDTLTDPVVMTVDTSEGCCIEFTTIPMTADSVIFTTVTCPTNG
jgi:hypothetical protein